MCGIWSYISLHHNQPSNLYNNFNKIKSRGPDRSVFLDLSHHHVKHYIGFHRLAIMDKSPKGDQPFITNNIYTIVNGEIYNYSTLKEKYNIVTTSNSDCEIIPHLFLKFGFHQTLTLLEGEFAIALTVIEPTKTTIYLARDRFGQRPLFYYYKNNTLAISSELKGLINLSDHNNLIHQFPPASYTQIIINTNLATSSTDNNLLTEPLIFNKYYNTNYLITNNPPLFDKIRETLINSVIKMTASDREIGALLSGGLDSSLIVSIASRYLHPRKLRTFSIGLTSGSTDKEFALLVSKHCNTNHTHVEFTNEEFINAVPKVIQTIESYDITTVRASTGQYLISKWISENTDIKVLLIGDGSDELTGGYLYFHKAPSPVEFHKENIKLLTEINYYDVLRADRGIAGNGLEARAPFLDHLFVDLYMSTGVIYRMPNYGYEKWLLRKAFDNGNYLPKEVLWRRKEAFSDGVSSLNKSWYEIIQESLKDKYNDVSLGEVPSKEAYYYLELFDAFYPGARQVIPRYWLPAWCEGIKEPSARVLEVYK